MNDYDRLRSVSLLSVFQALGCDTSSFKRRAGKAEWYGKCPYHQAKANQTSFSFDETGRLHCFSCEVKGRGAIDAVKLYLKVEFKEAVSWLEREFAGHTPQSSPAKKEPHVEAPIDSGDVELKPFIGKYGKYAVENEWLAARVPDKTIRDRYGVIFYQNDKRKSNVNRHVLIPIKDIEGVQYGWLARNIGETTAEQPKYRWPAGLPKGKFLFGAHELKNAHALPLKVVYVVESPWSVMRFASLGFHAVSPFGWSVSAEQANMLRTVSRGVVYLPDRNKYEEASGTCHTLAQVLWLRMPTLPENIQDPESLTREQLLSL